MDIIIIGLSILFFLGHFLSWFFVKTKIPDLLILIIIGFVLGPSGASVINPTEHLGQAGSVLSIITLIVILYEGGLHLSAKDLMESSVSALLLSLLSFLSVAGLTTLLLLPVLNPLTALLVGVGVGSTSSAIVIPMVKPLSISAQTKTVLSLESAFTDVLTIVIFLGLLEYLTSQGSEGGGQFFINLSSTPALSVLIGVISGITWAFLRKRTDISQLSFSGEAGALLTYGILEFFSLNGAIGVLALGFTLANVNLLPVFLRKFLEDKPVSTEEMSLLGSVTFLLRTFFFIYLGLLIQIQGVVIVLWAIALVALIFITRYLCVRVVFPKEAGFLSAITAVAMGPRGLACAVLATLPFQRGLADGEWIQNLIFAVIPFSILTTSVLVSFAEMEWFKKKIFFLFKHYTDTDKTSSSVVGVKSTSDSISHKD